MAGQANNFESPPFTNEQMEIQITLRSAGGGRRVMNDLQWTHEKDSVAHKAQKIIHKGQPDLMRPRMGADSWYLTWAFPL
jgi:hypothetical protein